MQKINFQDLPSTDTPINASNLNTLQTNVETAIDDSKDIYTETEQVVGKWVDGKPLYRKSINFGALPNNTSKSVAHNITNLKRIVKLEGFAGSSINKGGITLPHATTSPVALYCGDDYVYVLTNSNMTAYTLAYVFVYYTKTTD